MDPAGRPVIVAPMSKRNWRLRGFVGLVSAASADLHESRASKSREQVVFMGFVGSSGCFKYSSQNLILLIDIESTKWLSGLVRKIRLDY